MTWDNIFHQLGNPDSDLWKTQAAKSFLDANTDKNFVQRILDTTTYEPIPVPPRQGVYASHEMSYGEDEQGNAYIFPRVVQGKDGKLYRPENPARYAYETGEEIKMTPDQAKTFSEFYKQAAGWDSSTYQNMGKRAK